MSQPQQQPVLPLLNHNSRKRENNPKWDDEDDFADLLGHGDTDTNRSRILLNGGLVHSPTTDKVEEFTESFWTPRNSLENQTRQHYIARNRYIAEQTTKIPYASVYGTQNIKPVNKNLQSNLFGGMINTRPSGGLHGRTDWAAKYLK